MGRERIILGSSAASTFGWMDSFQACEHMEQDGSRCAPVALDPHLLCCRLQRHFLNATERGLSQAIRSCTCLCAPLPRTSRG